jgi:hypothetical protein
LPVHVQRSFQCQESAGWKVAAEMLRQREMGWAAKPAVDYLLGCLHFMSFKLIAQYETRSPVEPKFKQEIIHKILQFIIESRRPRSIQDIAIHIGLPESDTLAYMDILTKQPHWVGRARDSAHIRFVSRDGFDGYALERDEPAA